MDSLNNLTLLSFKTGLKQSHLIYSVARVPAYLITVPPESTRPRMANVRWNKVPFHNLLFLIAC
jgi:hypothetical protein